MRVYVPASWSQLAALQSDDRIPGPVRACTVDPLWRAGAPDVDEEEWEHEAQLLAAATLTSGGQIAGLVLAVDLPGDLTVLDDGWGDVPEGVRRAQVGAVLDSELAWFGLQELAGLLTDRSAPNG